MMMMLTLAVLLALMVGSNAFVSRFGGKDASLGSTKLYENFNIDFKNPKIETAAEIFTEKQLREYTAEYSVDKRINVLEFFVGLFKKKEEEPEPVETLSYKELEAKTADFVTGKIDAKAFYSALDTAFGKKLSKVLPDILRNLPAQKANELSKIAQ